MAKGKSRKKDQTLVFSMTKYLQILDELELVDLKKKCLMRINGGTLWPEDFDGHTIEECRSMLPGADVLEHWCVPRSEYIPVDPNSYETVNLVGTEEEVAKALGL